jgi:hypothetical protein
MRVTDVAPTRADRGFIDDWRPQRRTRDQIDQILAILVRYEDVLPLTLRQLFYILVAAQSIDKTNRAYRALGYTLRRARRARLVPFEAIADDGSQLPAALVGWSDDDDLAWLLAHEVRRFDLDPQTGQARRLLLWCEAAGMVRQLRRPASPFGIHVVPSGGFDSVTDKHGIAKLLQAAEEPFEILHIGDLDRAGEDIFRVFAEDAGAFCEALGVDAIFTRLALTEQQVDLYGLPAAPPEMTGGRLVVQAEALPPDILANLVDTAIRDRLDLGLVAETATRSATIRAEAESKLRNAGLWP